MISQDLRAILERAAAGHDPDELHRAAMQAVQAQRRSAGWTAHRRAARLLRTKAARLRSASCGALAAAYDAAAADVAELAPERAKRAESVELRDIEIGERAAADLAASVRVHNARRSAKP